MMETGLGIFLRLLQVVDVVAVLVVVFFKLYTTL